MVLFGLSLAQTQRHDGLGANLPPWRFNTRARELYKAQNKAQTFMQEAQKMVEAINKTNERVFIAPVPLTDSRLRILCAWYAIQKRLSYYFRRVHGFQFCFGTDKIDMINTD